MKMYLLKTICKGDNVKLFHHIPFYCIALRRSFIKRGEGREMILF